MGMPAHMALHEILPNTLMAPREARIAIERFLSKAQLSQLTDDAQLLASELVTNAVRHASGPIDVRAYVRDGFLRLEVGDSSVDCGPEPRAGGRRRRGRPRHGDHRQAVGALGMARPRPRQGRLAGPADADGRSPPEVAPPRRAPAAPPPPTRHGDRSAIAWRAVGLIRICDHRQSRDPDQSAQAARPAAQNSRGSLGSGLGSVQRIGIPWADPEPSWTAVPGRHGAHAPEAGHDRPTSA